MLSVERQLTVVDFPKIFNVHAGYTANTKAASIYKNFPLLIMKLQSFFLYHRAVLLNKNMGTLFSNENKNQNPFKLHI